MSVTIKDIAKILNVSYATVSKALSDRDDISEEMKAKVRKVAEELNYKPNYIARGLVKKETKTIGLIIPDITNPFYSEIAMAIEETVNKEGYSVFLCNSNWKNSNENDYINLLTSKKVDGIIIAPIGEESLNLESVDIPIVIVGTKKSYNNQNYVVIDDEKGGYIAVKHLIKQNCKKIMFVGGKQNVQSNKQRLEGYKRALIESNYEINEQYIRSGNFKQESGYLIMKKVFNDGIIPDGVFAGNDLLALGVMRSALDFGLKIPDDIKIVGFDDIPFASLPEISLTTILQPKYKMGEHAANMLLSKIKNPEINCENIILKPKLIKRKTG
ncbi:transcriptional regulator, LacI family [Caloramator quimbayensis]|uniref:Transcriptional regulator, LacI family n=1 Tax=Caloramator quimbayensis TaxID=1147123 RepID=A0A1T4XPX2_9CLOT|nr:LacI family DNA-binding transcriptional regulator [Caloramator quimbayensis]SKA91168.1 transcriptional regulator, LacI family [Caloramator quimbayensis]